MAVVLIVVGLTLAFGIPQYQRYNRTRQLHGATENIVGQMRLMREVAMASRTTQTMHFEYAYNAGGQISDYHVLTGGVMGARWRLPRGVTYYWGTGTSTTFNIDKNGRATPSGLVILRDDRDNRDTVSVLGSGLILAQ